MYRRYLEGIAAVCYSICVLAGAGILFYNYGLSPIAKLVNTVIIILSGYSGSYFYSLTKKEDCTKRRIMRVTSVILFVLYLLILADFTLVDETLGRNVFNILSWNETEFFDYVNNNTNLIPFETVELFINGYFNNKLTLLDMLGNIFGNLAAFMPFDFFVPLIFKGINRWYKLMSVVLPSVIAVELLQFVFLTGSSDIDDVILNSMGALIMYAVLRSKPISRALSKITFGEWNFNEKKQ